jgi:hypothetical protein
LSNEAHVMPHRQPMTQGRRASIEFDEATL